MNRVILLVAALALIGCSGAPFSAPLFRADTGGDAGPTVDSAPEVEGTGGASAVDGGSDSRPDGSGGSGGSGGTTDSGGKQNSGGGSSTIVYCAFFNGVPAPCGAYEWQCAGSPSNCERCAAGATCYTSSGIEGVVEIR